MARYQMMVLSNPVEGREDEFNDWYQNVHLPQVLALKGFQSAQRLRLARRLAEREAWSYATVYEIETDDIDGVLRGLEEAAKSGQLTISTSIVTQLAYAAVYEPCGAVVKKDERRGA